MVVYVKYQEPLMAFCVAMLAGIGFFLFSETRAKSVYFLVAAAIVLYVMLGLAAWAMPRVLPLGEPSVFFYVSVLSGALIVLGAVWLIALLPPESARARVWIARSLFASLLLELALNFIVPSFYVLNALPSVKVDPLRRRALHRLPARAQRRSFPDIRPRKRALSQLGRCLSSG